MFVILKKHRLVPLGYFSLMALGLCLLWVILPLRGLFFYQAFPATALQNWLTWPTRHLFSGKAFIAALHIDDKHAMMTGHVGYAGGQTLWLLVCFGGLCLCYLLAIKYLSRYVGPRFILISTLLLGVITLCIPVVTSQDVFSYIAYARAGVIYHLNPLTTTPFAIRSDPVYPYIYWFDQPSAYGPTWMVLTSLLQGLAWLVHMRSVVSMVVLLRVVALAAHLGSVWLLWQISEAWEARSGRSIKRGWRVGAMLALAWNPLLLFEAGVNAHNDTLALFLLMVVCWLLVRWYLERGERMLWWIVGVLALVACIKITYIVLFPGLLLYLWAQPGPRERVWRQLILVSLMYGSLVILLYAPFWQGGQLLQLFVVNPSSSHVVNSPYELPLYIYLRISNTKLISQNFDNGAPLEEQVHLFSIVVFLLAYIALCLSYLKRPQSIGRLPGFVRWLALTWLLFCLVGSIWFWPWYLIVFIGLAALAVALEGEEATYRHMLNFKRALPLLTASVLAIYVSYVWRISRIQIPGIAFPLTILRGTLPWVSMLFVLKRARPSDEQSTSQSQTASEEEALAEFMSHLPAMEDEKIRARGRK